MPETETLARQAPRDLARVRERMEREGIRALVATTHGHVHYLGGFANPLPFLTGTNAAVVVGIDGTPILCASVAYAGYVGEHAGEDQDVIWFGRLGVAYAEQLSPAEERVRARLEAAAADQLPDVGAAIAAALDRLGGGPGSGSLAIDDTRAVARIAGDWSTREWIDGAPVLAALREVKSAREIALLATAAQVNERAFTAASEVAAEGVPWGEVKRAWARTWGELGGVPGFWGSGAGSSGAQLDATPYDQPLAAGDLIRFEGGGVAEGYWADGGRAGVIGPPSERVQRHAEALQRGVARAVEVIGPGVKGEDVCAEVLAAIRTLLPDFPVSNVWGHGIGITPNELPRLRPGVPTVLEPGMAFCFETPYFEVGWGSLQLENTFVVTDHGNRSLTGWEGALVQR